MLDLNFSDIYCLLIAHLQQLIIEKKFQRGMDTDVFL
jgi:hypothetical protein